VTQEKWTARVEFAMHGEPTMHPSYVEMIRIAGAHMPKNQLMVTSNGGGLLMHGGPMITIPALFNAGLTILALDDYQDVQIIGKVREIQDELEAKLKADGHDVLVCDYPGDARGNPHRRLDRGSGLISYIRDISASNSGTHSSLNNHAGAAFPPSLVAKHKRCAKPFREMSIRWDGNVAICCNDWRGVFKCGNIVTDGLVAVWDSTAMDAARRHLVKGDRSFAPCQGCDALSYRVGLLPDPLGKEQMPDPDRESEAALLKAISGSPYTQPIKREWEK
jgi:MoaA/NifB/PqqE/SkfB family radical SAM enzyme